MGDVLDRVPTASLVVAVGLLVAAGAARALLYAGRDPRLRDAARLYLGPLCVWCMIAVVVYGVALAATGTARVAKLALILVIAVVAVALQAGDARDPGGLWTR